MSATNIKAIRQAQLNLRQLRTILDHAPRNVSVFHQHYARQHRTSATALYIVLHDLFALDIDMRRSPSTDRRSLLAAACALLLIQSVLISDADAKRTFSLGRGGVKKMPNLAVRRKPQTQQNYQPPPHQSASSSGHNYQQQPVKAAPAAAAAAPKPAMPAASSSAAARVPPPTYAQAMRDAPPSYGSLYPGAGARVSPHTSG